MKLRASAWVVLLSVAAVAATAKEPAGIAQVRVAESSHPKLTKLVVLGISEDRELRHRFEDRLVTHLRGRDIAARTSYTLVEDLTKPADRDRLLAALEDDRVDGVLSVRAVPLDDAAAAGWPDAWSAWLDSPTTVRELINRSLPGPKKPAKRYGVEITLWELGTGRRPWAARTTVYERKDLHEAAGDLMQDTIARLREAELL